MIWLTYIVTITASTSIHLKMCSQKGDPSDPVGFFLLQEVGKKSANNETGF